MKRRPYSASSVKYSFWFAEFRKTVGLLAEGNSFDDIRRMNETENIYGAATETRRKQIYATVTARIKCLGPDFYGLFLASDLAEQKLFALAAALAYDSLFFDFVYEVIREKLILGSDEFNDADVRIFFKNKQAESETVAAFRDETLRRLAAGYKVHLAEAGLLDGNRTSRTRKIWRAVPDAAFENWMKEHGMESMLKALTGEK